MARRHKPLGEQPGPIDRLAAVREVAAVLQDNRRQLLTSLQRATHRLPPLASIGASGAARAAAGKQALPPSPAVLAAVGLPGASTPQPPAAGKAKQFQSHGLWTFLWGGGSASSPAAGPASPAATVVAAADDKRRDASVVVVEYTKGKRRVYRLRTAAAAAAMAAAAAGEVDGKAAAAAGALSPGFEILDDAVRGRQRVTDVLADYLLPQGYPASVAPQYKDYMSWRGVQYFFGGAMSVFTTRSLLSSLGVANRHSSEAAAAINWVVKDGAGRLGRFLFARWGRELDCELKQFRLAGDALMEMGAALELSTVLMPRAFLPLACTANLAKNLAAVAASSTRAPIYRTFALQNNLADVTAKGESVANLADVVGTAFGIALAKANLPVLPTFAALSVGYLVASRREVDSVVLPYLNRARLSYATRAFYSTGAVPEPLEANSCEPLMPWSDPHNGRVVLGATVEEACAGPQQLQEALCAFAGRQYALTYRADTRKCYALLKQGASARSVLQAATDAHTLLWMLDHQQAAAKHQQHPAALLDGGGGSSSSSNNGGSKKGRGGSFAAPPAFPVGGSLEVGRLHLAALELGGLGSGQVAAGNGAAQEAVRFVAHSGRELHQQFERQAEAGGWRLNMTMLNPKETRLAVM